MTKTTIGLAMGALLALSTCGLPAFADEALKRTCVTAAEHAEMAAGKAHLHVIRGELAVKVIAVAREQEIDVQPDADYIVVVEIPNAPFGYVLFGSEDNHCTPTKVSRQVVEALLGRRA